MVIALSVIVLKTSMCMFFNLLQNNMFTSIRKGPENINMSSENTI